MIAALFVLPDGPYSTMPEVDCWPESRDARLYSGPYPAVAHPPCERWGRYWNGGPSSVVRFRKGDDNGCFTSALASVRQWGGVIEHPAGTSAWFYHGIEHPAAGQGWIPADNRGGWTTWVEQGHYGHPAAKGTWLYAKGCKLPSLPRERTGKRIPGIDLLPEEERKRLIKTGVCQRLSKRQRTLTPPDFASLLVSIARTAA